MARQAAAECITRIVESRTPWWRSLTWQRRCAPYAVATIDWRLSARLEPTPTRTAVQSIESIQTLFLDAGGVLLFPNWERVSETFQQHGIVVSSSALKHAESAVKFEMDDARRVTGTSDADRGSQVFNGVLDLAGVPRSPARETALSELYAYHTEHNLWEHVPPDVKPALRRLRDSGLTLAVVSNANGTVGKAFARTGLRECFDVIADSGVEGVEKPDPRFFEIVLQRTGSRADTTLHVGDLYHVDVVGARRAGLRAMLYDPDDRYGAFDVMRVRSLGELSEIFEMRSKRFS